MLKKYFGVVVLVCAMSVSHAWACSCTGPTTAQQKFDNADYVFTGRMMSARILQTEPSVRVRLKVDRIWKWKGERKNVVIVQSGLSGSCGPGWEERENRRQYYLVFARASGGILYTNICAGSSVINDTKDAARFLENLKK